MSDEPEVPWLVRQGELIEQITVLLPERIEGPWTSLEFTRRALSTYGQHNLIVYRPDGVVDRSQAAPRDVAGLLIELRKLMYREGAGTWLSATWTVQNHDGSLASEVDFNYDEEPAWPRPVEPGHYALDLEDFPRRPDATPEWLEQKVRDAEARA